MKDPERKAAKLRHRALRREETDEQRKARLLSFAAEVNSPWHVVATKSDFLTIRNKETS